MNDNVKYVDLLIISDQFIDESWFEGFDFLIVQEFEFIKPFNGVSKGQIIEFDKLITTDMLLKNAMREDGYMITNENFETSFDGYFAIGNAVKSDMPYPDQIKVILNYLKENY